MSHLEVKEVSKNFGGLRALDRASIKLEKGKVTGLIGPNGAGKTTLYNVITGFLPTDTGEVIYKGETITNLPPLAMVHRGICRTFQDLRLFPKVSVLENVMVGIPHQKGEGLLHAIFGGRGEEKRNREKAMAVLESVGLADRAKSLAEDLGMGEQKVLCLARALATNADIMLLDEPTANLDRHEVERMFKLIHDQLDLGKTVGLVEHNMEVIASLCDYVYALHVGQNIAEGSPRDIMKDPRVLTIYLGEE